MSITADDAIKLEGFIRYYTPRGLREPIHSYSFSPHISEDNYTTFLSAYKNGNLRETLESYSEPDYVKIFGIDYYRFDNWDVIEAIEAYFKEAD